MVGYPFDYNGKEISYSVGNPMGFYSSWASFAVTHHYIMYFLCRVLGKSWKDSKYFLLGDDIIIGDKELGDAYLQLLPKLGVDYSPAKTHISDSVFEFAKRWFYKGEEITPFPLSALKESGKRYYLLTSLFAQEEGKGWQWKHGVSPVVADFYGRVMNRPARFRAKMELQSFITEQVMKVTWEVQSASVAVMAIARKLNLSKIPQDLSEYSGMSVLVNVVVQLFSESDPTQVKMKPGTPGLGDVATNLVMLLTSIEPYNELLMENPLLHAYGSIEQTYLDMCKKAREIDTVGKGEWPLILRSMSIPLTDEVFIDRRTQTSAIAVSKIAKVLVDDLRLWNANPGFFA
uniref:RNA dependent RNA polymerase n=1 Tax=Nigrospora sphaerica mitovirus 3 TaxID=2851968 RepID=A0A915Y5H2_9VIRU|nr:RNA dependent RNA polymerase [Nigrospora sphaerica mitovirus 3]